MKWCPRCGGTEHLNAYVDLCEYCYNNPNRGRYYPKHSQDGLSWYVMQEIPGNNIVIAETVHGQPDAEMIADALNAWRTRYPPMTHQGSDDLLLQLATRLYTLAEKGSTDIRPFSSVGHDLQARYTRLATECLRQMEYAKEQHPWPLSLAPPDWKP